MLLPDYDPEEDGEIVVTIFRTRIIPEMAQLREEGSEEIRGEVIRLALDLLCKQTGPPKEYVLTQFCDWFRHDSEWRDCIEKTFEQTVSPNSFFLLLLSVGGY